MQSTAYVALSQQTVLNRTMEVLANNLANASTTAFKAERPIFREFIAKGPQGQTVSYVQDVGVTRDLRQGDLATTGNPLDTAIDGNGYFAVDTVDGTRYTRNGKFQLGPNGQLETAEGDAVLSDQKQPISVPAGSGTITIGADGTIAAANGPIGKIGLVHFDNPEQLVAQAGGLYVTDASPSADTTSQLRQGMVEGSNIKPIVELTRLIGIQRAYSSAQQMIEGEDQRIRNAIDKLSQSV